MCDRLGDSPLCMDCKNELNLCKLCVRCVKAKAILSKRLIVDEFCALNAKATNLSVDKETVNSLCVSDSLAADKASANMLNANKLCAMEGTINKLCVNELTVGALQRCEKYRAAVTSSVSFNYALGSDMNWNVIVDDPNGNVSLAPFKYTVPVSGYYVISYHLSTNTLTGPSPIAGIPLGVMQVKVNGADLRTNSVPLLSFVDRQKGVLTSLSLLNAGDQLTMNYQILALDPALGLISYAGAVNIEATGAFAGQSGFAVHYLSSLECTPGGACVPCQPVSLPCSRVEVACDKEGICHFDGMHS